MVKRNLAILQRLKQKWQYDRKRWSIKQENLERQLNEISSAQKETAAALAERVAVMDHYHNLSTQLSEKDLLLAMRKREILRYHQQLAKSESKANGILNQCRIWVQRTQERDTEIQNLQENNNKIQLDFEIALSKLCQYKDRSTTDIAALQTENIELKQKVERTRENNEYKEQQLHRSIHDLSDDLREALKIREELQKSLSILQRQLDRSQAGKKQLEEQLRPLAVRMILRICSLLGVYK